jgi:hypothetical protein
VGIARRGLRRRLRETVDGLPIPHPFDVTELCRTVGRRRGRELLVLPITTPGASPCGVWIAGASADYIFYEQDTSLLHRTHIILHELGHIVCGHAGRLVSAEEYARLLLPDLDARLVRTVLGRGGYSGRQEREAELIAATVWARVHRIGRAIDAPEAHDVLARMQSAFGEAAVR